MLSAVKFLPKIGTFACSKCTLDSVHLFHWYFDFEVLSKNDNFVLSFPL